MITPMNLKQTIILAGITLTAGALCVYLFFRIDAISEHTENEISSSSIAVMRGIDSLEKKAVVDHSEWTGQLEAISKNAKLLAVLAAVDKNHVLLWSSKNRDYILTEYMYNSLMNDFTGGKIQIPAGSRFISRYYRTADDVVGKEDKLYCSIMEAGERSYLAAFAYRPGGKIMVRIAMEIALIIVLGAMTSLLTFLMMMKRRDPETSKAPGPAEGDTGYRKPEESLRTVLGNLFTAIGRDIAPESCILHCIGPGGEIITEHRYTGGTINSDAETDPTPLPDHMRDELVHSSVMITAGGTTAHIPLVHENALVGILTVRKAQGIAGGEIRKIRDHVVGTVQSIADYIAAIRLFRDEATGLFNKEFCDTILGGCISRHSDRNSESSLILIELENTGAGVSLDEVIQSVAPMVKESLPKQHHLCRYDRFIAVVLPGMDRGASEQVSRRMMHALQSAKLRIQDTMMVPLRPKLGLATTGSARDPETLLTLARRDMRAPLQ
jgi:GGDEF domain-containing protein